MEGKAIFDISFEMNVDEVVEEKGLDELESLTLRKATLTVIDEDGKIAFTEELPEDEILEKVRCLLREAS